MQHEMSMETDYKQSLLLLYTLYIHKAQSAAVSLHEIFEETAHGETAEACVDTWEALATANAPRHHARSTRSVEYRTTRVTRTGIFAILTQGTEHVPRDGMIFPQESIALGSLHQADIGRLQALIPIHALISGHTPAEDGEIGTPLRQIVVVHWQQAHIAIDVKGSPQLDKTNIEVKIFVARCNPGTIG